MLLFEVRMKDLVIYAQEQFFPSGHDMKGTYLKRPTVSETYRVAVALKNLPLLPGLRRNTLKSSLCKLTLMRNLKAFDIRNRKNPRQNYQHDTQTRALTTQL